MVASRHGRKGKTHSFIVFRLFRCRNRFLCGAVVSNRLPSSGNLSDSCFAFLFFACSWRVRFFLGVLSGRRFCRDYFVRFLFASSPRGAPLRRTPSMFWTLSSLRVEAALTGRFSLTCGVFAIPDGQLIYFFFGAFFCDDAAVRFLPSILGGLLRQDLMSSPHPLMSLPPFLSCFLFSEPRVSPLGAWR